MCDEKKICNRISIDDMPVWLGIFYWNFVACVQCVLWICNLENWNCIIISAFELSSGSVCKVCLCRSLT